MFGYSKHPNKDGSEHVVMYNKESKEHWSYDRKETVPGWNEIENMHHTYDDKDSNDPDRFEWKDPGRSVDVYGDKDK